MTEEPHYIDIEHYRHLQAQAGLPSEVLTCRCGNRAIRVCHCGIACCENHLCWRDGH